jgi:Family of unknown function (DUF6082)
MHAETGYFRADCIAMGEINVSDSSQLPLSGSSFSRRKLILRKTTVYLSALLIGAGTLAFILASPLLLHQLTHIKGIDWAQLSNIGQTYGAASALLSGMALIGITLSLLVQARQARTERIRITRERHADLLRLVLEAPDVYGPVIGYTPRSAVDDRRLLFCTMWVNYARIGFHMGVLTEETLHDDIFGPAFTNDPMRKWWLAVRRYWSGDLIQGGKDRKFVKIIDEEYRKAIATAPTPALNVEGVRSDAQETQSPKRYDLLAGTALGVAIGILLGSRLRHKNH